MNEATANLLIVIAIGVIIICFALIVVWWKVSSRKYDESHPGAMPDYPPSTSANMWQVSDPLDPNQLSERQFKEIFGMSRNQYVERELGGWQNVDLLRRYQLGNLNEKQYERAVQEQVDQAQGRKKPRRSYGNDPDTPYRRVK